jgi:anti-sigma regulatory factor (Ser/Thr protein kinase)
VNDPTVAPNPEHWLRPSGQNRTRSPLVLVGVDEPGALPDTVTHEVLQVPLADVVEVTVDERPNVVVLVAGPDRLASSKLVTELGRRAGVPVVVLDEEADLVEEVARMSAPSPPELVALPIAAERGVIGLAPLRQELRQQLGDRVEVGRRQDAELCLTELVANAARHGRGEPSATVAWALGRLRVSVTDEAPVWPSPGFPDEEGGRGLRLIQAMADAWGVSPAPDGGGGKVVWFELVTLTRP